MSVAGVTSARPEPEVSDACCVSLQRASPSRDMPPLARRASTTRADRIEVVIFDNGSSDGSVAWLRAAWPDVRVLEGPRNLGFAAPCDRAAAAASGELVAFLNNDLRVEPSWLARMTRRARGPRRDRRRKPHPRRDGGRARLRRRRDELLRARDEPRVMDGPSTRRRTGRAGPRSSRAARRC